MINNLLDNDENIKDKLLKLSLREIRLEAKKLSIHLYSCLLYTSDAADDTPCVHLGGRRII